MYCHQSALGKRWLPHKQFFLVLHFVSVEPVETGLLSRVTGGERHGFVIKNTLKNITVYAESERDKSVRCVASRRVALPCVALRCISYNLHAPRFLEFEAP